MAILSSTALKPWAAGSIATLILLSVIGCSSVKEHPLPSEEAAEVVLTQQQDDLAACKALQPVLGYGTYDDEVKNDLRHQAAVTQQANAVLLINIKEFYQTERLGNYLRTPELKAPKATIKYYYKDAFTLKAKGMAYRCP